MAKGGFFSSLFGDPLEQAAAAEKEGRKEDALRLYAKGGDFHKAATLAADLRQAQAAVEYTLRAIFGQIPAGYEDLTAAQAGELLAKSGHLKESLALFELSQAWPQAADAALKLQQPARAARYFERAKSYGQAALYYGRAGQAADALRVLELESNRLKQALAARRDPAAEEALRKVELERAEILAKQGKRSEAADLLKGGGAATPKAARLLEQAGNVREAIEAYAAIGEKAEAARLLAAHPNLDRRFQADTYRRIGRPLEAAQLYASLGALREAAEGFEEAGDFARAGAAWEAGRDPARAAQAFVRGERFVDAGRVYLAGGQAEVAARAFARGGDPRGAAAAYEKAGRPLDAANAFRQAGDRAQAARVLRAVPRESEAYVPAVLALAPILLDERAFDEALSRLQGLPPSATSGGSGATGAEIFYWQGRVLEALGSGAEAIARYRQGMALKPDVGDAAQRALALSARFQLTQRFPAPQAASVAPPTVEPTVVKMAVAPPSGEWPTGFRLADRYEILGELGKGGMGRVYKARDHELDDVVALKTVLRAATESSAQVEERLLREIQICRKITHPNVVRVYDLGRFPGGVFITMEYLEGKRLDELIRRDAALPLERIRGILEEIVLGLHEAHALHIVHRDLKPSNVILTDRHLKILDFGIARMDGNSKLTQTGFAVGSPLYMSPEQLQGMPLDGRSDLYALGVLAFALLAGREPFTGDALTVIAIHHIQSPVPDVRRHRPDLPIAWVRLLERLLGKRPEDRPDNAVAALDLIRALPV